MYGFADSSPQVGRDWLIVKTRFVRDIDLVCVFEAAASLVADAACSRMEAESEGQEGDVDEELGCQTPLVPRRLNRNRLPLGLFVREAVGSG